jgi:hypothetical protein
MNLIVVNIIVIVVLIALFLYKTYKKDFSSPPHEFAYGIFLKSIEELPDMVEKFLSLEVLDPGKIEIETIGDKVDKTLNLLIRYITSKQREELEPLISSLKEIDTLSNNKEKVIKLIKALIPYRDQLRDEENQDELIVFIKYGMKQPVDLPLDARGRIEGFVTTLDTPEQTESFKSERCPTNYFEGNINIYPLALENTFWHGVKNLGVSKNSPILEIRFLGLKGIFKYLIHKMENKTGKKFKHLDGELIG